jgi:hypothetical protein
VAMLKGTIQNGEVRLAQPANLPDGTGVTVLTGGAAPPLGIPDDEWPTDAEGIARLLAHMNSAEPFEMTAVEEAEIERWRAKVKEFTLAKQAAWDCLFEPGA